MKISYARVSIIDQNIDMQKDTLENAGCDEVKLSNRISPKGFIDHLCPIDYFIFQWVKTTYIY